MSLERYRELETRLLHARWARVARTESQLEEEDVLLEEMDVAWTAMTEEERETARRDPVKPVEEGPVTLVDRDVWPRSMHGKPPRVPGRVV